MDTYEKAYKEALEKAKYWHKEGYGKGCQEVVEDIFPELRESEDERIRKRIIDFLWEEKIFLQEAHSSVENNPKYRFVMDAIAWLEKQKEPELSEDLGEYVTELSKQFPEVSFAKLSRIVVRVKNWLEKQGERESDIRYKHLDELLTADDIYQMSMNEAMTNEAKIKAVNALSNLCISKLLGLERQGEQKPTTIDIDKMCDSFAHTNIKGYGIPSMIEVDAYRKGINDALNLVLNIEKQGEQKVADKIGPKFNIGDWVVYDHRPYQVVELPKEGYINLGLKENGKIEFAPSTYCRHWTIRDAKDGDLIYVSTEEKGIQAIFHEYKNDTIFFHCYLCSDFAQGGYMPIGSVELVYPLQKTHYNRFFEKMHEAGYEWDADKKESKEIEDEEYNGEDYGIDSLYHAQRILEKTLGEVDGYQTDDGILDHKCAISAVKKLYEQKPAWSEEDEYTIECLIDYLETELTTSYTEEDKEQFSKSILLLKSLKDRVQPIHEYSETERQEIFIRSQRPHFWRPSEEQVKALKYVAYHLMPDSNYRQEMFSLYEDLKKLTE